MGKLSLWGIFRILVATGVGATTIYWIILQADAPTALDFLFVCFLGLVNIVFFAVILLGDRKSVKHYGNKIEYLPGTTCGVFILIYMAASFILSARDSSPIIAKLKTRLRDNCVDIEFRKDSSYKVIDASIMGADIFRGKYSVKDSIITLFQSTNGKLPKRWMIYRRKKINEKIEMLAYPADSNGNVTDIYDEFNVIEKNNDIYMP